MRDIAATASEGQHVTRASAWRELCQRKRLRSARLAFLARLHTNTGAKPEGSKALMHSAPCLTQARSHLHWFDRLDGSARIRNCARLGTSGLRAVKVPMYLCQGGVRAEPTQRLSSAQFVAARQPDASWRRTVVASVRPTKSAASACDPRQLFQAFAASLLHATTSLLPWCN